MREMDEDGFREKDSKKWFDVDEWYCNGVGVDDDDDDDGWVYLL